MALLSVTHIGGEISSVINVKRRKQKYIVVRGTVTAQKKIVSLIIELHSPDYPLVIRARNCFVAHNLQNVENSDNKTSDELVCLPRNRLSLFGNVQ